MDDLLKVTEKGSDKLQKFVSERLIEKTVPFHSPLPKTNLKTFGSLYSVTVKIDHQKVVIKADRDLFRRMIIAIEGGRTIDIDDMLTSELCPVPLSLAQTDGSLLENDKPNLAAILCNGQDIITNTMPSLNEDICIVIDAMSIIRSMGKPNGAVTFGHYATCFQNKVCRHFSTKCKRVDVVFDSYMKMSIKDGTRKARARQKKPIRTIIKSSDTKLPHDMERFLNSVENKRNLTAFLSEHLQDVDLE